MIKERRPTFHLEEKVTPIGGIVRPLIMYLYKGKSKGVKIGRSQTQHLEKVINNQEAI